ncbi:acyltransferase family protein [Enterococcus dongliensis]|uniref:acyltransferase family protein n=1 Tax=Enterococcus dongliensis TaxID=2559925 RepID=UPI00289106AD|nr:acyltransferase family protein [Enterococcus dongliensis]MDT2613040.1 acyltransferase family protein [Enterococcus dongliensis]
MSTITKPNREYLYDNIRGILILLVVLGHALEYFRLDNIVGEFIYIFIYLFHMPVFIFISGYFSKNLAKGRSTAVETFLVPYLLLNMILSLIMLAIGKIDEFTILSPGWTLWYLYCMFIWRLLLPDLVKVRRILILSFIIGIFSGFLTEFGTYMAMARTLGFLPYFLAGYFMDRSLLEKIHQLRWRKIISGGIILIGLGVAYFWVQTDLPPEILWRDRSFLLFKLPIYQNILNSLLLYLVGFAFVFVFLSLAAPKPHFFTSWGQKTLAIYLLHVYLVAPLVQFTQYVNNPLLHLILLVVGTLLILYVLSRPKVATTLQKTIARILHFIMPNN